MKKIYYVNSNQLPESSADDSCPYTMVDVIYGMGSDMVSADTYAFDIPCAYASADRISNMVSIKADAIKELNWDNVLNDLKEGSIDRKYWYWDFLCIMYDFDSLYIDTCSNILTIYKDYKELITISNKGIEYEKRILRKLDIVLNYMIDHNIDKDNAKKLLDIVRNDPEVRMTHKEYFEKKYGKR